MQLPVPQPSDAQLCLSDYSSLTEHVASLLLKGLKHRSQANDLGANLTFLLRRKGGSHYASALSMPRGILGIQPLEYVGSMLTLRIGCTRREERSLFHMVGI